MREFSRLFVGLFLFCNSVNALNTTGWFGDEPMTAERVVNDLVEYFSQQDPLGIPVINIPEPIYEENRVAAGPITLWDVLATGLSQLRLEYINLNLTTFTALARVSLPSANVQGQYEWPGWWSTSQGDANITMNNIDLTGDMSLAVNDTGILIVDKLAFNLVYGTLYLDFTGLSSEHSVMVGAVDLFFGSVLQPLLVGKGADALKNFLNGKLNAALEDYPFPDSVLPVDYAVAKVRRTMREQNLDPLYIERREVNMAWEITLVLKDITLSGITTLHRTAEVSAQFIDNAIFATIEVGTQKLKGGADWSISAALLPAISGHLDIEIESLSVTIELRQPADIRSPPVLRKIDVQLGNFAVRSAGERTMDYAIELLVNVVPNVFRNIIVDNVEPKLHQIIQKELNGLDLHRIIMDRLAAKRRREEEEGIVDDDE